MCTLGSSLYTFDRVAIVVADDKGDDNDGLCLSVLLSTYFCCYYSNSYCFTYLLRYVNCLFYLLLLLLLLFGELLFISLT